MMCVLGLGLGCVRDLRDLRDFQFQYRKTMKFSLRCMRKAVNFLQRTVSISSDCLIAMEIRTELTLGSMRHLSVSVLMMDVLSNNARRIIANN